MTMTRRGFLGRLGRSAIACGSLPLLLDAVGLGEPALGDDGPGGPAEYWERLSGRRVRCTLCPLRHALGRGERGPCRVRENHDGVLRTHAWENPAILKVDPVEKLPATHFRPATRSLTIATGGCNLHCLYCQNWQQSQSRPEDLRTVDLPAVEAVRRALEKKEIDTVAFSYTEPMMAFEYVRDIAARARAKGLRTIMATGGYVNEKPLLQMCRHLDAITVGLKAFTDESFRKLTERSLPPLLETIRTIRKKTDVWLELTNLVVPTYNDERAMITTMCRWIVKELGPDVPLHFGRFVPRFRLSNLPQTPLRSLTEAREIALAEGIRHAYVSNVAPHEGNNTTCPECGRVLIRRIGFKVLRNDLEDGRCPRCRREVAGRW
jgi:pyruvate formate lyase activating enzyme